MAANKKVMSIAIRPELQDELDKFLMPKGLNRSSFLGDLLSKVVKIKPDEDVIVVGKPIDEEIVPVVLKIPKAIIQELDKTKNTDTLKKWMQAQTEGLINAFLVKKNENSSN